MTPTAIEIFPTPGDLVTVLPYRYWTKKPMMVIAVMDDIHIGEPIAMLLNTVEGERSFVKAKLYALIKID